MRPLLFKCLHRTKNIVTTVQLILCQTTFAKILQLYVEPITEPLPMNYINVKIGNSYLKTESLCFKIFLVNCVTKFICVKFNLIVYLWTLHNRN